MQLIYTFGEVMRKIILLFAICLLISPYFIVFGKAQFPNQNDTTDFVTTLISNYDNYLDFLEQTDPTFKFDKKYFNLYTEIGQSFEVICVGSNKFSNDTSCFIFKPISSPLNIPIINYQFKNNTLLNITDINFVNSENFILRNTLCKNPDYTTYHAPFVIIDSSIKISYNPKARGDYWATVLFNEGKINNIWEPYKIKYQNIISNDTNLSDKKRYIDIKIGSNDYDYTYEIFQQDFQEFNSTVQNIINQKQIEIQNKLDEEENNKLWINSVLFFVFNLIILLVLLGILYTEEKKLKKEYNPQYWIIVIGSFLGVVWAFFISDANSDYFQKGFPFIAIFIAFIIYLIFMRKKRNKIKDENDLSYFG